jgi:glycosyltransferase involved in cell wall biosynthesis
MTPGRHAPARLVVVLSGFPRMSETFALGEVLAMHDAGLLAAVYATKAGDSTMVQPGIERLADIVRVLPAGDAGQQAEALVADLAGRPGEPGLAAVGGVHGYFAHQPAAVAELAAARLGVPFTFSVHALDARKVEPAELARRSRAAAGVVACNPDVAEHVRVPGAHVTLLPHGVDLDRFRPQRHHPGGTLRMLAVGRFVEKKGFPVLLDAVARMRRPWSLRIVGGGPMEAELRGLVERTGIGHRVEFAGRRTHDQLPADYAWADVVVVPSIVDSAGDRDGLPNVVLEAMACGRAVVASDVSAIGETVRAAGAGPMVPPQDAGELCRALEQLAGLPRVRREMAEAGRRHVETHYCLKACTDRFLGHLTQLHGQARRAGQLLLPTPAVAHVRSA